MRNQIDKESLVKICDRFLQVSEEYLGLNMKILSEKLGYKNQSTLTKVRKRKGFIGPDKLNKFGTLTNDKGQTPNIHFIITGQEPVFIEKEDAPLADKEIEVLLNRLINKIGKSKAKELLALMV